MNNNCYVYWKPGRRPKKFSVHCGEDSDGNFVNIVVFSDTRETPVELTADIARDIRNLWDL